MVRGNYTPNEIKKMTDEEILFIFHYQDLIERERMDSILKSLGVLWDLDLMKEIQSGGEGGGGPRSNKIMIPLAAGVNPKIFEMIKNYLGSGSSAIPGFTPKEGEKVVPISQLSKEEFLNLVGGTGVAGQRLS